LGASTCTALGTPQNHKLPHAGANHVFLVSQSTIVCESSVVL
jgi:hypothetical protein